MIGSQRTRRTLAATLALVSLSGLSLAARAQETPPPAGNDAPAVTPRPAPGNDAPPAPPTAQPSAPPAGQPPGQPGYTPPGQGYPPGYPPPGQGYPPGDTPPGYAPGYAPPGYPPGYPPPRYAPPVPAEPMHGGVYVHLHLGGGFTSISRSDGYGGTVKYSGGGVSLAVAVGGAVAPNLALFGNFFVTGPSQPDVTGASYGNGSKFSGDILVGGFGAGVVYYFMPVDIYLSGAVAAVDLQASDSTGKTTYQSDIGVGFQGMLGKEFWVSEHWGLGAAIEFVGAPSMKDKNTPNVSWSAGAFNLLFSATCF